MTSPIVNSYSLAGKSLVNRIALAPLTRGRGTESFVPGEHAAEYYAQRSGSSGAGLIITEATGISREGLGWYRAPGIWNEEQQKKWAEIFQAIHAKGSLVSLQLWHMGRQAHSDVTGQPIISASAIPLSGEVTALRGNKKTYETPRAAEIEDITRIVKEYAAAAKRGFSAGVDLVEIHAANGYLIDQFMQSITNQREDEFGGSIENRLKMMKMVVEAVIESAGGDASKVSIRFSPNGSFGGMGSDDNLELFDAAIRWTASKNLGYIHLMDGTAFGFHEKTVPYTAERARKILNEVGSSSALMVNVGYEKDSTEAILSSGNADLVAVGRPFISNPDLVYRWMNGIELNPPAEYADWWGWNKNDDGYTTFPFASNL